jgi:hypothetical protein
MNVKIFFGFFKNQRKNKRATQRSPDCTAIALVVDSGFVFVCADHQQRLVFVICNVRQSSMAASFFTE